MNELVDRRDISLSTPLEELEQIILQEDNAEKLQSTIEIFNLNLKKKDLLRTSKLSDIEDKIVEQISLRLDKKADEFSNKELSDYLKIVNDAIKKSQTNAEDMNVDTIQITQNQINVGNVYDVDDSEKLDVESRQRVTAAVAKILANLKTSQNQVDNIIDVEEVKDDN